VIPLLALIDELGDSEEFVFSVAQFVEVFLLLGKLGLAIIIGRYLLRYVMRLVVTFDHPQIFLTTALFTVVGSGILFEEIGLSMGLGAFIAGVLLADSEYRHQLEADIIPFKGLLLGLFFMAVGMSANIDIMTKLPLAVALVACCLVLVKGMILFPLGYLFNLRDAGPRRFSILLAQGGEFAFVLLTPALGNGLINQSDYDVLVVGVTLSMICTPLLFMLESTLRSRSENAAEGNQRPFDKVDDSHPDVFIAGFGRVGQIIGRVLQSRGIPFVAMDANPNWIDTIRLYGNKVYFGDLTRPDVLRSAGLANAKIFICAIGDVEASLKVAEQVRQHFPQVRYFARARNRQHALALRALGAEIFMRETLLSSLSMAESVLKALGFSKKQAKHTVSMFREHDENTLDQQYSVRNDEDAVIQLAKDSADQLRFLLETDAKKSGQEDQDQ
ncbi:MAG: cation:proton antiporter, partial [Gammaproteobacteria bacterium]